MNQPFTEEELKYAEALGPCRATQEIRRCWARIEELIEANNREVEKRRAAENDKSQAQEIANYWMGHSIFESYYRKQIEWSRKTFGPGTRTLGIVEHITKELREVQADPFDRFEWIDLIMLAMDGYWRHGGTADGIVADLRAKQTRNMARTWPSDIPEDHAIEHEREAGQLATGSSTNEPS